MISWDAAPQLAPPQLGARDWLRVLRRGVPLALVLAGGLAVLLLLRVAERPLCGLRRPVTPYVTQFVCRAAFRLLGLPRRVRGRVMRRDGICVANHASWLDIFALNASKRIYFVSKHEVAGWPAIGWLARATGTVFIRRDPREAARQAALFERRLRAGHRLLFFPEGTSTDGLRVLAFKPTLFAALFSETLRERMHVQPVTLAYHAPAGADPAFYGWWGEAGFAEAVLRVLARRRQGHVEVIYHEPMPVAAFEGRKALARAAEERVREGLREALDARAGGTAADREVPELC
ncbi:1-acyl-sn-glycerol-3-phosphate acyltransferase [Jannaschia sp. W003]|uniref:lysophospholipid acyltransferase family protein n=1 Tax=Jannaschia sp. W003 TaxID=2867012 RepID=UPI0021A807D3|nr:lysophospholipid acyltransferase family protein [Jannaschia sp. W003]UWQ20589.1 1-acyl-sn-glycerol-3-phosphate acyltransferase [Jannaschia sp. W003]